MIDKNLLMSDAQAVTVASSDTASTNVIDFGLANPDLGAGTPVYWVLEVHTTVTSGGSATLQVTLQDSADNSTFATLIQTEAFAKAVLVAGFQMIVIPLPAKFARYLRTLYDVGTADLTAGNFNSYLTLTPPTNR